MGLVEQPELGPAGQEAGQRRAAALAGGEAGHRDVEEASGEPARGQGGVDVVVTRSGGTPPELDVVTDRELVVEPRGVAQETHAAADLAGLATVAQIVAEHPCLTPGHGQETGAGAQQGRLPGTVRAAEEHDLTGGDVEVDPGERREPTKEGHRASEVDDGLHGDRQRLLTGVVAGAIVGCAGGPNRPGYCAPMRLAKILGALGRSCITVGTLLLLFVAYQLWGTGIREAQAQSKLKTEFNKTLNNDTIVDGRTPPPAGTIAAVPEGDPTAVIDIPKIGVHKIVVEGVGLPDLKKGPGHYPGTPLPGQKGNAAIAGHRTTYGAPFNRVDELKAGDSIFVQTVQGKWRYVVKETQIVSPTQVEVLDDKGDNRLTLTACHPKYSAAKRIVMVAELGPNQTVLASTATSKIVGNLDGGGAPALPAIILGVLCAAIWAFAWALGRLWRRWPAYALGFPFFLVALFFFFEEFSRLLPSNF